MTNHHPPDFTKFMETARTAALAGGAILRDQFTSKKEISFKGPIDIVTNVDIESEKAIIGIIRERHPGHDIVTEETNVAQTGSDYRWIIDPLDGTVNYAHSFPFVAVSVGLEIGGELAVGAVYDPIMEEFFHAVRGGGAFLNGERIAVSDTALLERSLLATGFAYDIRENPRNNIAEFSHIMKVAQAIRRPGSAALDCCYVAMGRFDGYWELSINPWDIAAGILIIREAGGKATTFEGPPLSPFDNQIVASNGRIHEQLLAELTQARLT